MNERLSKQVLINGGSDHLKSWFCMIVLASTINSKMILKPPPKYIWPQTIKFQLLGHSTFISTHWA